MAQAVQIKDRTTSSNLVVNTDGSLNATVSGTVTATPTGTQAVSGTVGTYPVMTPSLTGVYVFNLPDVPAVVASNNYLSLFNPVGSGKTVVLLEGSLAAYVGGGSSNVEVSLQVLRVTAASAGTLQAASAICKFQTAYPNAVAEVRTGNPTVTVGAPFVSLPPVIQPSTNNFVYQIRPPVGGGAFTLVPGEGIVFRTTSGDTDEQYNINMVWGEF